MPNKKTKRTLFWTLFSNRQKKKKELMEEKALIQSEREEINLKLVKLNKEIELAKARQRTSSLKAKKAMSDAIIESKKAKERDKAFLREREENIKKKQKNILLSKNASLKKLALEKQRSAIRLNNLKANVIESKQKLIDEKKRFLLEIKARFDDEKEQAIKLKNEKKLEIQKLKEQLRREKLEQRQAIINKKLELRLEMNNHKKMIQEKLLQERKERMVEVLSAKKETALLQKEQQKLKNDLSHAKIKARIKKADVVAEYNKEISQEFQQGDLIKLETQSESLKAKEEIKTINTISKGNVDFIKKNHLEEKAILVENDDTLEIPQDSLDKKDSGLKTSKLDNIEDTLEIITSYVKAMKGFEKNGEKRLKIISEPLNDKEVKKLNKIDYFKTAMENWKILNEENLLIGFKEILKQGLIMSSESINEESVDLIYKTLIKALLNKMAIRVGKYNVVPSKHKGKTTFVITQGDFSKVQLFDIESLLSNSAIKNIEILVDYQLTLGVAIRLIDGLAIENNEDGLQVALNANIVRI